MAVMLCKTYIPDHKDSFKRDNYFGIHHVENDVAYVTSGYKIDSNESLGKMQEGMLLYFFDEDHPTEWFEPDDVYLFKQGDGGGWYQADDYDDEVWVVEPLIPAEFIT